MPPAKKEADGAMAIFHAGGHQLGSVGQAFMAAAIDQAPGFIDADTGEDMEELLDKEELKKKVLTGEIRPCGPEHIYPLFSHKEDKKK